MLTYMEASTKGFYFDDKYTLMFGYNKSQLKINVKYMLNIHHKSWLCFLVHFMNWRIY